jgi:hypothetical protein
VKDERGALRFVDELGFVLLMPMRGAELPSMQTAAGGGWDVWWDWKQTLPERRACFYSHLLRRRGTFLSWEWFPAFYAAHADPLTYRQLYRAGRLDRTEKQILDLLDARGPLMTRELRLLYGPPSKENTRRVKQTLVELQRRLLICAAGGDTTGWSHHRWDLVDRWVGPELMLAARGLSREEAREKLVAQFIRTAVATTAADIAWLFAWERAEVTGLLARLLAAGRAEVAPVAELGGEVVVPKPWPLGGRRRG